MGWLLFGVDFMLLFTPKLLIAFKFRCSAGKSFSKFASLFH